MVAGEAFGTTHLPVPPRLNDANGSHFRSQGAIFEVSYAVGDTSQQQQQPVQQEITKLKGGQTLAVLDSIYGASSVAVNARFVVYGAKDGLIQVWHRPSSVTTKLRAHHGQIVTDLQFFNDGDILATAGYSASNIPNNNANMTNNGKPLTVEEQQNRESPGGKIVIWRVFERSASEILSERMLEIRSDSSLLTRVIWHPFNPNQFWMIHRPYPVEGSSSSSMSVVPRDEIQVWNQTATLVETTRISTSPDPIGRHAVAGFSSAAVLHEGAVVAPWLGGLVDLAWSTRDSRYAMAVYHSGEIVLLDIKKTTLQQQQQSSDTLATPSSTLMSAVPEILQRVKYDKAVTRCVFLPHAMASHQQIPADEQPWTTCFLTGASLNAEFVLWSPFTESAPPLPIQSISLVNANPSSYILNLCVGLTPKANSMLSCFVTLCCREQGTIHAVQILGDFSHLNESNKQQQRAPNSFELVGACYVVPFRTKFPIFSCSVTIEPPTDISEDEAAHPSIVIGALFDIKLHAYQSEAVQTLTLTANQCLPPTERFSEATLGVSSKWREVTKVLDTKTGSEFDDDDAYEDYDIDEEDEDDEMDKAPDPSTLPVPGGATATTPAASFENNAFANWLGAMAAKTTTDNVGVVPLAQQASAKVHAPVMPPKASVQVATLSVAVTASPVISTLHSTLLSPLEILASNPSQPPAKDTSMTRNVAEQSVVPLDRNTQSAVSPLAMEAKPNESRKTVQSVAPTLVSLDNEEFRRIIREEVESAIVPIVIRTISEAFSSDIQGKLLGMIEPLQSSLDILVKPSAAVDSDTISTAVSASLHGQICTAFSDSVKSVLIPSIESMSGQVLHHVAGHLENVTHVHNSGDELESISKQLTTMTQLMAELAKDVQSLRVAVSESSRAAPERPQIVPETVPSAALPAPAVDPMEAQRARILSLLKNESYEEAFRIAVSNTTVEMTVFCCRHADLQQVLSGAEGLLSQPILLCLMQQLGTVIAIAPNPVMELEWLQEIALSLDPKNVNIQAHVPNVLQQVVTNISQRLNQPFNGDNELALRRLLQRMLQVVRGIQM